MIAQFQNLTMTDVTDEIYYWFLFYKGSVLVEKNGEAMRIPLQRQPPIEPDSETYIHQKVLTLKDKDCKAFDLKDEVKESNRYVLVDLRASYFSLPEEEYLAAGKCYQYVHWYRTSNFCPRCGHKMELTGPIKRLCPECKFSSHPIVFTCILALVRRDNKILLVQSRSHRGKYNSLVAGYLESGENLEQCVQREVMEETGLTIKNLQYFGSQSWPYPSQMMVGFICDYESGEPKLQESELIYGAFYTKDELPELPPHLSLSRKMIDWWVESQK